MSEVKLGTRLFKGEAGTHNYLSYMALGFVYKSCGVSFFKRFQ